MIGPDDPQWSARSAPSPAGVEGGRLVRLVGKHRTWASRSMSVDQAELFADKIAEEIEGIGDAPALLLFHCGDGRKIKVRARDIVAVETQACTSAAVHP